MDRKEEYLAKLRDPRWQKMRLKVLERDEFTCTQCFDSESTLHVHHRWYQHGKEPWEYDQLALVTLCESCHEGESQSLKDAVDDFILILKQSHAMSMQFHDIAASFIPAVSKPLHEYSWEVVAFAIKELVDDYVSDDVNGPYSVAVGRYQAWCAKRAAELDAAIDGA